MEVFMRNVSWNVSDENLREQFASYLHAPAFHHLHPTRMNFHVFLHPDRRKLHQHGGTGVLTLPNEDTVKLFLDMFGTESPRIPIALDRKIIKFQKSTRKQARKDVLEKIVLPYMDPWVVKQRKQRTNQLTQGQVAINTLQFGWECRDYVFSIECEKVFNRQSAIASFKDDRRELQIEFQHEEETFIIAINQSQINEVTVHHYLEQEPIILLSLTIPPTYMRKLAQSSSGSPGFKRLAFLPIPDHERVAPYASLAIRLVCTSTAGLREFERLSNIAQLRKISNYEYPVQRREIFSAASLKRLDGILRQLKWCISFQILALLYGLVLDVQEILGLMDSIVDVMRRNDKIFVATLLRKFASRAKQLYWSEGEVDQATILQCFHDTEADMLKNPSTTLKPTEGSLCDSYHVIITPTRMFLDGPHPERSNRVIRAYDPIHHESFLRVSFLDEAKLQYRFDRDIDGPSFIRSRVGPFLLDELRIAGRQFKFLAYSQSALKEHAVW